MIEQERCLGKTKRPSKYYRVPSNPQVILCALFVFLASLISHEIVYIGNNICHLRPQKGESKTSIDFHQSCSWLQSDLTGMQDCSATSNKLTCSAKGLQECGTTCRVKSWQSWKHTTKQELTSDISSFSGAIFSKWDSSKGAKKKQSEKLSFVSSSSFTYWHT